MPHLVSLREYEALRVLLLTGKTTAAAHSLGVSQSSISRAIAQLEAKTGQTLFRKDGTRLIPTTEAHHLNVELDELFEVLQRIERREWVAQTVGQLRIAATASLAHHFLSNYVADFHRLHPDVKIVLDTRAERSVWDDLLDGRYDLCATAVDIRHSGIRIIPFHHSRAVCVMPSGHDLEACEEVGIGDLCSYPLIAMTRRLGVRLKLDRLLLQYGLSPKVPVEVSTPQAACNLVRAKIGVAVINPFPYLLKPRDGLSFRPLVPSIEYKSSFALPDVPQQSSMVTNFINFVTNDNGE